MTRPRLLLRVLKGCSALLMLAVLGVAALLLLVWLEHRSLVTLPVPTGSFAVGREIYDWPDSAVDTLAPVAGATRELLVWMWYPAVRGASAADEYLPVRLRSRIGQGGRNIWTLLTRDVSTVRGHSLRDANVSPQQLSYPVVILRAGASSGVLNYSTLAEDLASHGYVVVGFDAPYRTGRVVFADGRVMYRTAQNNPERCVVPDRAQMERCVSPVLRAWTADTAYVLDRLAQLNTSAGKFSGRLDLTRVGVVGHSFGGAVAAQFCHDDARCKAGVDIDGAPHGSVIREGLRQPFLFLLSDHASEAGSAQILADIQSIYDRLPPDRRLRVVIRGAFHYMFSDDGALLKSSLVRGVLRVLGRLRMTGRRQLAVTSHCLQTFFDVYLKGAGGLNIASPRYPEIQILK
jgi:predicted dienelactone hydrolase